MVKTVKYFKSIDPESFGDKIRDIDQLKSMMIDCADILDKNGIPFWLAFGTLLGLYRDKHLIEYDADADMVVQFDSIINIIKLKQEFEKKSFSMAMENYGVILYRGGEHIDLYHAVKIGNGILVLNVIFPQETFIKSEYLEWEGRKWKIPGQTEKWLAYVYGSDWKTPRKLENTIYPKGNWVL